MTTQTTSTSKRQWYGVNVQTPYYCDYVMCRKRSTADRIRRVLRHGGYWPGAATVRALINLTVAMPGKAADAIIAEFQRRGIQNSLKRSLGHPE